MHLCPASTIFSEFEDRQSTIASELQSQRQNKDATSSLHTKLGLPNMHTGLHHFEVAQEYGGCNMVFTLLGEDKHK